MATILFTDIEGSTSLWEREPERMSTALSSHDALIREVVGGHRGTVVKMLGDGVIAVFDDPLDALNATIALQRVMADVAARTDLALGIRCGLHEGPVERRDDDYFGRHVNRAARIMSAAHGGQVLLSAAVAERVRERLPAEVFLRDLGSVRLRDLASTEHLYQLAHPSLRRDFPALRSLESIPNNMPGQLTSFVGREQDITDVLQLLRTVRLVTLVGPGGIGKTRLSLQAAAAALDEFANGAWLVELAPLTDATLVPQTVARVLGVREEAGTPLVATIAAQLRTRKLLLIMDNCEHVAAACAELVDRLLHDAPGLTVLASSREPLRIDGEHTYSISPLALPDAERQPNLDTALASPAVQLFVDRARQQQMGFALGAHNVSAVVAICRRLDGIPLAIELAAARVRALPAQTIAERLDDRFRLLTGGSRSALPRQQTLRALIDWSHDLLSIAERTLFARLAVFAGGWTLEAAESVCTVDPIEHSAILGLLASLVDKSLVVCETVSPPRYSMLETIRAYARDRLRDAFEHDAIGDRHLSFYLDLAEQAREKLRGTTFTQGIDDIERERENLFAAQAWCTLDPARATRGLRLVFDLQGYWDQRAQYGAGLRMATLALCQPAAAEPTLERAQALVAASLLAYRMGRYDEARDYAGESVSILRACGPSTLLADALIRFAHPLVALGDVATAQSLVEERLVLVRALGDQRRIASTLNALAELHRVNQRLDLAAPLYEEALQMARRECDLPTLAVCQLNVALVSVLCGEPGRAAHLLDETLRMMGELDFKRVVSTALDVAFAIAVARREYDWGARVLGASEALSARAGQTRDPADAAAIARFVSQTRTALGEAAFEAAYAAGRALSYDDALASTRARLSPSAGDDNA